MAKHTTEEDTFLALSRIPYGKIRDTVTSEHYFDQLPVFDIYRLNCEDNYFSTTSSKPQTIYQRFAIWKNLSNRQAYYNLSNLVLGNGGNEKSIDLLLANTGWTSVSVREYIHAQMDKQRVKIRWYWAKRAMSNVAALVVLTALAMLIPPAYNYLIFGSFLKASNVVGGVLQVAFNELYGYFVEVPTMHNWDE